MTPRGAVASGIDFSTLRAYADNIEWLQSERYILAHILHHPDSIYDLAVSLRPEHFSNSVNRAVYTAMLQLQAIAKIDIPTLSQVVSHPGADAAYFSMLEATTTDSANIPYHLQCIHQAYARRLLFRSAVDSLSRLAEMGPDESVDDVVSKEYQRILDIQVAIDNTDNVLNLGEYASDFVATVKQRAGRPQGVFTNFPMFDELIGGLISGRLYVISARSKTGKTALLMNWTLNVAVHQRQPVLYINTEMTQDDMMPRMLACLSGVPEHEISNGAFLQDPVKVVAVNKAVGMIKNSTLLHVYLPTATIEQITSLTRKYKAQHDIQLLVYDYIKDTTPGQHGRLRDDVVLGLVTTGLKNLAGTLRIPVLTAAQLNRGALQAQEVSEAYIYGSDQILFYSDYVFYLRKLNDQVAIDKGIDPNRDGNLILQAGPTRYRGEYSYLLKFDRPIQRITESDKPWEE